MAPSEKAPVHVPHATSRPIRDLGRIFNLQYPPEPLEWPQYSSDEEVYAGYHEDSDGVWRKIEEEQPNGRKPGH